MDSIVVERLNKAYGGDVVALRDVSFEVRPGEIVSILGPNGAGKTTLLRVLMALTRPTGGEVRVLGSDVSVDPVRVRREVGYAPQSSTFDDYATPLEALTLLARLYRVPVNERSGRIATILSMFNLGEHASRPLGQLSGGMRRKLDLAAALIHEPKVLVMDEPTAALDPAAREDLWRRVKDLVSKRSIPVLFTTHLIEEADRFSDRVLIMNKGELVAQGAPEQLKASLGGETIGVRVGEDLDPMLVEAVKAQLGGTGKVQIDGRTIHVGATNAREELWRILDRLNAAGLTIASTEISCPSLNDVYLRATGRAYDKDETSMASPDVPVAPIWFRKARA